MKLKYNTRKVNWSAIEEAIKRVSEYSFELEGKKLNSYIS